MLISGIDENWISALKDYVGQLFTDISPLIILVIGLPLAFWVIQEVIKLFRFEDFEPDTLEDFEEEENGPEEYEATPRDISLFLKLKQKEKSE